MAGVKGRSGGARPGAGRKPKPKPSKAPPVDQGDRDMLQVLQDVALGRTDATPLQVRAAIAAVQYTHTKRHDGGKRDEQDAKAKRAAVGRFSAPPPPPKLVINNA